MQGNTGPYIQNAYVRILSVLRKAGEIDNSASLKYLTLNNQERALVASIFRYNEILKQAAENFDPSVLANYCYELARSFHKFYNDYSFIKAESPESKAFRLKLSKMVGVVLKSGMELLGIEMPEKM